jgi:hypothetical protein
MGYFGHFGPQRGNIPKLNCPEGLVLESIVQQENRPQAGSLCDIGFPDWRRISQSRSEAIAVHLE